MQFLKQSIYALFIFLIQSYFHRMDEDEFITTLAQRIKKLRIEKGLTQFDVATKMGIEDSSYRKIESGRTNPTARTLYKLAEALDVSVGDLFSEEDFKTL
ncbi:MAG: hypothetical protein RI922_1478 [Bacteroidota bacterium]|jgi:DNA-binding XRE family transcriptional regulator